MLLSLILLQLPSVGPAKMVLSTPFTNIDREAREIMYLVASVRLVCPSTHSRLNRLTYESLPVWGVCLCVCNESAYVDNRADAVDRLLICSIGLGRSGVQLGPVRSPMRNNNMNCTIFTVDMLIYGGEGHKIVPTLFQGPFTKISLNY